MPPKFYPTSGHILICQNNNCQGRGSALLYKALWNHLEREGLAYYKKGGKVRLTESGCLGACSYGPTLCVYRQTPQGLEEGWYAAVDFPVAKAVAQAVQDGSELPEAHKYGPEQQRS
ncbi:hypothetical protein Dxin01_00972 [Deinococcus xinjiangensis]|uniref:Ferredoxin n=1 Tax=Deinococcus xinjiangensis TaxID=457454 RepID=A0ABP9V7H8_9DEIO